MDNRFHSFSDDPRRSQSFDLTTEGKALAINQNKEIYGCFAEIGAGQEVVRHFFKAGGASSTVAKSMSAYDMTFSDAIYGKEESNRYVCESRLLKMLDHEYMLLKERLWETRSATTKFFVLANTVAAGDGYGQGWMGVRFQAQPQAEVDQIVIHLRLYDDSHLAQQEALGVVGVNLLHSAFFATRDPEKIMLQLIDDIDKHKFEIDMIRFTGPTYKDVDSRLMCLLLVKNRLANATMFSPKGEVLQPSEVLHKKHVLIQRGSFRPVTQVNQDMLSSALAQFSQEPEVNNQGIVPVLELTLSNLLAEGEVDTQDFLDRATVLETLGHVVMISNYAEYYRLSSYISKLTDRRITLALGVDNLEAIFEENYYAGLDGGILEAFGKLFRHNVRMYIYPKMDFEQKILISARNLLVKPKLRTLYSYLREARFIEPLVDFNEKYLDIFSRKVLKLIREGGTGWENMVPDGAAKLIKDRHLFGFESAAK